MAGRTPSQDISFRLIAAHVGLTAALGQVYGKLGVPLSDTTTIYTTELVLAASLLLGAGALRSLRWDRLDKLVALLVVLATGWFVATGGNDAGKKAFSFFVYAGFYYLVRALIVDERDRRVLVGAVALGSLVGAGLGLWNLATGGAPIVESGDLTVQVGFLVTPSDTVRWLSGEFGLYGMFALLIATSETLLTRHLGKLALAVVAAALIELTLVQHRSVIVGLPIAFVAVVVLLPQWRQALPALRRVLWASLAALAILAFTAGQSYLEGFLTRMAETGDTSELNAAWRLLAWAEVGQGVVDRPLGHGFADWDFAFNSFDPLTGSHNSPLDLTYRIGVPGLVVLALILVELFRRLREASRAGDAQPPLSLVASGACVVACVAYASFNVVFETPYESVYFWLFLAVAATHFPSRSARAAA